ncbi:MAG: ATP-binding protein [bacterium]|nr:ATP-binding protein [bacterium]
MFKESETIELKESFSEWKEIIISLASFANRKGGKVIVGVNDLGEFTNMKVGRKSIEDFVNKVKQHTDPVLYPSINVKEFALGEYVEIEIPESDNKPIFAFDKAYIRTGKSNLKISNTHLRELIKRYQTPDFDRQTSNFQITDNTISVKWFLSLNEKHFKIDSQDVNVILTELGVLHENKLTQAGFLCFASNIASHPNALIKLARFKGDTPDVFIDMKNTTGNIIESVNNSLSFITRSINMNVEIGKQAQRIEKWEYPIEALREGLINAIVHRDYTDAGNIQVRIFDNRIEIWSPGLLPRELNLAHIETECRSIPRNKKIAELFFKVGLIENWGTGFTRMISNCKTNGNPRPVFEEKAGAFVITFLPAINEGVNEGVNELFLIIKENPGQRVPFLAQKINTPGKTVERWLKTLKDKDKIEFKGNSKTGGYFVVRDLNT